jgi:hypothetical protein
MQLTLSTLLLLACGQAPQATHQSANFIVTAATPEVAKRVAESAESHRARLAKLWLEKELPDWSAPCRIEVVLDMDKVGGRTTISFCKGRVSSQRMEIRGPLGRLLKGPLPHELTHVLFAHYFGAPPPRWADEGGAILSEDAFQGDYQRRAFSKIMAEERCFGLRRLLDMRQYPDDIACLYAQGHSFSRFLVDAKSRKVFLAFVRDGAARGWDAAVRDKYGYDDVEQLEQAWLGWARRQTEKVSLSP